MFTLTILVVVTLILVVATYRKVAAVAGMAASSFPGAPPPQTDALDALYDGAEKCGIGLDLFNAADTDILHHVGSAKFGELLFHAAAAKGHRLRTVADLHNLIDKL